ncbi:class I SAM-dependent methyltransferase [Streptomyces sp. R44]|uniref:Class I SAM-dependent methyltransferase n=1 Tax=Streptomyces sp. R44 TaxID=3238633 RepID=A0AB39TCW3_9ACTN
MDLRSLLLPAPAGTDVRTVLLAHPSVATVPEAPLPGGRPLARVTLAAPGQPPGARWWKRAFDLVYRADASPYAGWRSSLDGQRYPAEHMAEWAHSGAALARESPFRTVLEIGAGTGLLARRLAPLGERYVCTDASAAARDALRRTAAEDPSLPLEVSDCPTETIGELALEPDLVILHSVIQYFPDLGHLLHVVRQALDLLRPGGRLLIGDVRALEVAPAHFAMLHQHAREAGDEDATVADIVGAALSAERELLVDSAFFQALPRLLPTAASVEVRHRRARLWNEMAAFRFDVVVRKQGTARARVTGHGAGLADTPAPVRPVRTLDQWHDTSGCVLLSGVPNSRLDRPTELLRRRLAAESGAGAPSLPKGASWHPDHLQERLDRSRPGTRVRWSGVPGAIDVLACENPATHTRHARPASPPVPLLTNRWATDDPALRAWFEDELARWAAAHGNAGLRVEVADGPAATHGPDRPGSGDA